MIHTNSKLLIVILAIIIASLQSGIIKAEEDVSVETDTADVESAVMSKYTKPVIDYKKIEKEADALFYTGIENEDRTKKEAYLDQALTKYMLLLSENPFDAAINTQVGAIHDNLGHSEAAKDYFTRAVNLENLNPFANFYFGEYYFSRREYNEALKYYLVAYNNGYANSYEVNLKLATIYEKLGDIQKAQKHYIQTKKLNPKISGLGDKIKSLREVYYSKSDYSRK